MLLPLLRAQEEEWVFMTQQLLTGGWDMCGGNVGLGGLGAVGTGADAGTGGGIGAGAFVAGIEVWPPVSGGDPPAPFVGGKTCGEEDGNSSKQKGKIANEKQIAQK